jgi:hypothetical protein
MRQAWIEAVKEWGDNYLDDEFRVKAAELIQKRQRAEWDIEIRKKLDTLRFAQKDLDFQLGCLLYCNQEIRLEERLRRAKALRRNEALRAAEFMKQETLKSVQWKPNFMSIPDDEWVALVENRPLALKALETLPMMRLKQRRKRAAGYFAQERRDWAERMAELTNQIRELEEGIEESDRILILTENRLRREYLVTKAITKSLNKKWEEELWVVRAQASTDLLRVGTRMVMRKLQEYRYLPSEEQKLKEADEAEAAFWKTKEWFRQERADKGWAIFHEPEEVQKKRERLRKAALLRKEIIIIISPGSAAVFWPPALPRSG